MGQTAAGRNLGSFYSTEHLERRDLDCRFCEKLSKCQFRVSSVCTAQLLGGDEECSERVFWWFLVPTEQEVPLRVLADAGNCIMQVPGCRIVRSVDDTQQFGIDS